MKPSKKTSETEEGFLAKWYARVPSIWSLLSVAFLCYMGNSIYTMYQLYHPAECSATSARCLHPSQTTDDHTAFLNMQLRIYASTSLKSDGVLVFDRDDLPLADEFTETFLLNLPRSTRNNGSLYLHAYLLTNQLRASSSPSSADVVLRQSSRLSVYTVPVADAFNLLNNASESPAAVITRPLTHINSKVQLLIASQPTSFDYAAIPQEIVHLLRVDKTNRYYPIFYLDEMSYMTKNLVKVLPSTETVNLTIAFNSATVGRLRMLVTTRQALDQLKGLGFTDKDCDDVKGIFTDTNFYLLILTMSVATVHLLLDVLAFKNDISFWRGRKDMVGLSTRTLVWNCISHSIISVYLFDQNTSLLVLIPAGFGTIVEFWKLTKALKIRVVRNGMRFSVHMDNSSQAEMETAQHDTVAMKYLAYAIAPCLLIGSVYSLLYTPHTSWLSWCIQTAANGVYAFGFLFMLPQLFVNYKLRSVAHLPWRAFAYKAFNTFIDDLFAFIIHMPTAHRVACFRDDLVFVAYLYQRYLYPVDKKRVNEYGQTFEGEEEEKKDK